MSPADMTVVKVWVMSVTSNRVLIEEKPSYGASASPVKGIIEVAEVDDRSQGCRRRSATSVAPRM